jgi:hypothetical protein
MAYVVLCGPANRDPDRIVGPFESSGEAERYADGGAAAARVVMRLGRASPARDQSPRGREPPSQVLGR